MPKFSLVKIIPWFGQWPEWFDFFLESCRHNPDIDWLFYTDAEPPKNVPENVRFNLLSFSDYKELVSNRLNINFNPVAAYKLCDIKPALGYIHHNDILNYDFFAFGDIDVIYGRIRHFISDDILSRYNVISTHENRISGHFCIFRNIPEIRSSFMQVKDWRKQLENPEHLSFDESHFTKVFIPHRKHPKWLRKLWSVSSKYQRNILFREQFSTILSPIRWKDGSESHPQTWFWQHGKLTNNRDNCEYMYLHFMNFKSRTWLPKQNRHQPSAWETLDKLISMPVENARETGFAITPQGFCPPDDLMRA